MLTSYTLDILNFLVGVIVGVYLPLAGLYLFNFSRQRRFGFRVMWQAGLLFLLICFGFLLLLVAFGLAVDFLKGSEQEFGRHTGVAGLGALIAFLGGTILFFVGL